MRDTENDLDLLLYLINFLPDGDSKDTIVYKQKVQNLSLMDINYVSIQNHGLEFCSFQQNKLLVHSKSNNIIKIFDYFPLRLKHFDISENSTSFHIVFDVFEEMVIVNLDKEQILNAINFDSHYRMKVVDSNGNNWILDLPSDIMDQYLFSLNPNEAPYEFVEDKWPDRFKKFQNNYIYKESTNCCHVVQQPVCVLGVPEFDHINTWFYNFLLNPSDDLKNVFDTIQKRRLFYDDFRTFSLKKYGTMKYKDHQVYQFLHQWGFISMRSRLENSLNPLQTFKVPSLEMLRIKFAKEHKKQAETLFPHSVERIEVINR